MSFFDLLPIELINEIINYLNNFECSKYLNRLLKSELFDINLLNYKQLFNKLDDRLTGKSIKYYVCDQYETIDYIGLKEILQYISCYNHKSFYKFIYKILISEYSYDIMHDFIMMKKLFIYDINLFKLVCICKKYNNQKLPSSINETYKRSVDILCFDEVIKYDYNNINNFISRLIPRINSEFADDNYYQMDVLIDYYYLDNIKEITMHICKKDIPRYHVSVDKSNNSSPKFKEYLYFLIENYPISIKLFNNINLLLSLYKNGDRDTLIKILDQLIKRYHEQQNGKSNLLNLYGYIELLLKNISEQFDENSDRIKIQYDMILDMEKLLKDIQGFNNLFDEVKIKYETYLFDI